MRIGAILRAPLLHFVLGGGLLFAASGLILRSDGEAGTGEAAGASRKEDALDRIEIDRERVAEIRRAFGRRTGRAPSPAELDRMLAVEIDEELLHREALARGLAAGDPGIEARLVQKMLFLDDDASPADGPALAERARALGLHREDVVVERLLAEKLRLVATTLSPEESPDEGALRRAYVERREKMRPPARRTLVHVFVSRDRRGERTEADTRAFRKQIEALALEPSRAIDLGDPFPSGHALTARSTDELARQFGEAFAERVEALPVETWSLPIASAYGLHLVRVDAILPGEMPAFEAVRERLRLELENELRERKLAALLAELRTRYKVAAAGDSTGADRRGADPSDVDPSREERN